MNQADAEQLLDIIRALSREMRPGATGIEALGLDHALERDFGLDSLARVELLARIERDLGVKLAEAAFAEAETPRDLLRQMGSAVPMHTAGRTDAVPMHAAGRNHAVPPAPTFAATIEHPPETIATLTEMLDWHVAQHGARVHITLYGEGEQCADITYRMLQAEALALAAGLLAQGVHPGDRIAIMLPTGREFFAAFYGALYAGCVPVPLYPPARPSQLEDHMRRIAGIVANAEAAVLVTDPRAKLLGSLLQAQCPSLRELATVAELSASSSSPFKGEVRRGMGQNIAFLQYTSGSTGDPKGVVLTHANLLANLRAMEQASGVTADDIFVSWLPLYHDMGLIGACLGSMAIGFRLILMSPLAFLARPERWLAAIHRHRATVSAAPNFAYELCANKLSDADLAGLDLSCWRLAYNGAEPVSPDTLARFAARLAQSGFNPTAMTPVYGLAESSVGLAFPPLGRGPLIDCVERNTLSTTGIARPAQSGQKIVTCGRVLPGHDLRIVDAQGRALPERTQGRVQFRGPSATSGYYRNPEATAKLFDGDWLNTGDLGYLAAGELYLTGREKDIIIRGGHNIYPQELEEAASRVAGVRKGGVAVFPATAPQSGSERLVVLAETIERDSTARERIVAEINRLAVDLIGLPADDIVLAPPRSVLKTSSGKIRRAACRELYERGKLGGQPGARARAPWLQMLRLGWAGAQARSERLARAVGGRVWSIWAWAVFATLVPLAWILIVLAPALTLRRHIARLTARAALSLTGLTPGTEGLRHLAGNTPLIVVANHASYLDGLILTAVLPPRFAYVVKQELLGNPFAAIPLRRLDSAFVERFDGARGVLDTRTLETRMHDGDALLFFPEGTFRKAPGLLPFRMGAFVIAANTGKAVVSVTLTGTRALLPGESLRPRHSPLQVWVDAPLLAPPGDSWQAALQLRDAARRQMLARLDEHDAIDV